MEDFCPTDLKPGLVWTLRGRLVRPRPQNCFKYSRASRWVEKTNTAPPPPPPCLKAMCTPPTRSASHRPSLPLPQCASKLREDCIFFVYIFIIFCYLRILSRGFSRATLLVHRGNLCRGNNNGERRIDSRSPFLIGPLFESRSF